jgi:hypothetical protein
MLEEIKHIKISKKVSSEDDLDFEFLKSTGIEYIESLGASLWSDMNVHDPGVTILEALAYAITDLGNRMSLPIESLIASEDDLDLKKQFYRADKILPTSPTTALDYRKKFSDIPGVRNSWIIAYERPLYADCKKSKIAFSLEALGNPTDANKKDLSIKGLNAVIVDYDLDATDKNGDPVTKESINEEIKRVYHKHRNLCEDLVEIREVAEHPIGVCANIELENSVDEDLVHAKVLNVIEEYFAPEIQHHSLKEMLDRGYRTDQIFEGPFLDKGFIDPKELAEADLRSEVRLSDLVKIIMEIDGVKLITDISIRDCQDNKEGTKWLIEVKPYTKPKLCSTKKGEDACCTVSSFSYAKDILPVTVNDKRVAKFRKTLLKEKYELDQVAVEDRKIKVKRGQYLNSGDTTTIQNEFPETYGISKYGLAPNSSEARKSQALQLKGYLAFFDQILASYFSHLSKVKDLLSISTGVVPTYFTQAISDIKDFDKIVDDYPMDDDALLAEKLFQELDNNIERRNAILDHLLARFAENFSEYTFLMNELYGRASNEMVLYSKEQFLREYVDFSARRGDGYDIYGKIWDTKNVAGAQKRISRLTGIRNYFRRNLSRSLAQIYIPEDSTTNKVMWRILNNDGERLLYSALSFKSTDDAMSDLYKVIGTIAKMDVEEINEFFEIGVSHGDRIDDVVIYQRPNGQYKFNVVDPNRLNPAGEPEIIGIFSEWDVTLEDLRQHLIEIIEFLRQEFNEDGMYIVEHVFLLPDVNKNDAELKEFLPVCIDDCDDCCTMDPYSFKVSVILPGYTQRFADQDFRNYMELLIQAELPSHIVPRICWIGHRDTHELEDGEINQLMTLEKTYKKYLTELKDFKVSDTPIKHQTWLEFTEILFDLFTLHPVGRLHDCDSDEDLEGKIILGRTNLGSL